MDIQAAKLDIVQKILSSKSLMSFSQNQKICSLIPDVDVDYQSTSATKAIIRNNKK